MTTLQDTTTTSLPQDGYCVRFLRRKSNCIFLLIMLLISLLSVMQVFVTKMDDQLVNTITTSLLTILKASINDTEFFANKTFIQ